MNGPPTNSPPVFSFTHNVICCVVDRRNASFTKKAITMPDQSSLFGSDIDPSTNKKNAPPSSVAAVKPFAGRIRPRTFDPILCQEHILAPERLLRPSIEEDHIPSMIFCA